MNILIDTHIFLWWLKEPSHLKKKELKLLENPDHTIYVSAVTSWEIIIKKALKKLVFQGDIKKAVADNFFKELPVSFEHTMQLEKLPPLHQDPFDRLLIAQSQHEDFYFMTHDQKIKNYELKLI